MPPAPPPQNDLERFLKRALDDPALQGEMMRRLWAAELLTFIPDHPEVRGEFPLQNGDSMVFCKWAHPEGEFMALFTSDAVANWAGEQLPPPSPAVATMPGEVLFRFAHGEGISVRVNHGMPASLRIGPQAVESMVDGSFRTTRVAELPHEKMNLVPAQLEDIPSKLLKAIRVFCVQRRMALAVYAFHPAVGTEQYDAAIVHFMVRLREEENDFFNDFCLMVEKLTPPHLNVRCAATDPGDEAGLEFLQRCTPIWPLV